MVPESLDDDVPYVSVESIPSDLIRHVIALGDEREGGLLTGLVDTPILPLGDVDHYLEVSDRVFRIFQLHLLSTSMIQFNN